MQTIYKGKKVNLPDFMIVGAAKSGTTTLYRVLAEHPQIFFPPSEKEPFYFCFGGKEPRDLNEITRNRSVWKTEDYLGLYEGVDQKVKCGDASTSYLYRHDVAIPHMGELYGEQLEEVKIIILLRNPIDRAYSHYTFLVRNGFEELSFEEALLPRMIESRRRARWGFDYLNYGAYAEQVAHYMSRFPQCNVYLMEDLKDKQGMINDITRFLSVDELIINEDVTANPSGIPKSRFLVDQMRKNKAMKWMVNQLPENTKHKILNRRDRMMSKLLVKEPMRTDTREMLKEHYTDEILKLESIIGRSLEHWR